ncbi:TAXI family TRAP transporter solute-binding subunit [Tautonia rosea]|uniref:TAXI family TRAP transporter solute-binding subunit n=1 Tax=Tautonia rosea TaxID=2728037 RepID=UPI001472C2D9|nr:TAXI family TRAP transporter solute-binding subunit [Tautonia rosea]
MAQRRSRLIRRGVASAMLAVLIGSAITWLVTREWLPRTFRISSGQVEGRYHEFARRLGPAIEARLGRPSEVLPSEGSLASRELLLADDSDRRADLAILQGGSVPLRGLTMIAPLFPDVVHVVARADRGIETIEDLRGRCVSVGEPGSGMQVSAQHLLDHYAIELDARSVSFDSLAFDDELDAAIVTTNSSNRALRRLLAGGQYVLVPVIDADAIALIHYHYHAITIPRGLFCESPRIPAEPVPTVATTAFLATRADAPARLVEETLEALYSEIGPWDFPDLIPRSRALDWHPAPMHPAARSFFDPFDHLGWTATVLESLSALKELLFAMAAGAYLLWDRWRRVREREKQEEVRVQKERLDLFLEQTAAIEREQMDTDDPRRLRELLDRVVRIKLHALSQFTHETLRGDGTFALFLLQCNNLTNVIQLKIVIATMRQRR